MTGRRALRLAVAWVVTATVATVWVAARTGDDVSTGDAMLVGAVAATALTAALARLRRR
jgi:hypothetical protein